MNKSLEHFASGLFSLKEKGFSQEIYGEAKKCVLDYLGVTFAGAKKDRHKSKKALQLFASKGEVPVIGLNLKADLSYTILFNGIHSHVIELDDGHRYAMMHPGGPVLSSLLPVCLEHKISGINFLKAVIIGYEASIKLASALQPSLKQKGFHGTGIAGCIGSAAAIATALHFDKTQFKDALAAASTSASGILKVSKNISELKPYNVGNAALSGYQAAILAYAGFKGPNDTFDGELGFLSMMSDQIREEYLDFSNNQSLAIQKIYRKPYAACRHCHAPIEAALLLKEEYRIVPTSIQQIEVETYALGVPGHDHQDIVSINSAKMSTPYSVGVALAKGKVGVNEFSEVAIQDPITLALTKKVEVKGNDELSKLMPDKRAAIVHIHTIDKVYSKRVDYPKGEPENPIVLQELRDKFISLAKFSNKTEEDSENIIEIILNLETRFQELISYL